jgi:hypothetical protein
MKLSPTDILKRHARERWLRIGIRSANLDGDVGSTPRMSESAWVDSCQLVRGVPDQLLDVLGVKECEGRTTTWNEEAREVMGVTDWYPTEQVAEPLTLAAAARRLGLAHLDHKALKAMRLAAVAIVTENLLTRRGRENGVGGMKTVLAVLVCVVMLAGCGSTEEGDPPDAAPDAQPVDAEVPDAHIDACASSCGGCGEPGHSCCLGTAPDPAMYCLDEGVVCDQLSNVCIDLR